MEDLHEVATEILKSDPFGNQETEVPNIIDKIVEKSDQNGYIQDKSHLQDLIKTEDLHYTETAPTEENIEHTDKPHEHLLENHPHLKKGEIMKDVLLKQRSIYIYILGMVLVNSGFLLLNITGLFALTTKLIFYVFTLNRIKELFFAHGLIFYGLSEAGGFLILFFDFLATLVNQNQYLELNVFQYAFFVYLFYAVWALPHLYVEKN